MDLQLTVWASKVGGFLKVVGPLIESFLSYFSTKTYAVGT